MRLEPPAGAHVAVLGACGGIGRAIVAALQAAGARVSALDLPWALAGYDLGPDVWTTPVDGSDADSMGAAFGTLRAGPGLLSGLVIAAGFAGARLPLAETSPAAFDEVIAGNLRLTALALRAAPACFAPAGGAIVTLSSDMAYAPQAGYGAYVAAKAGIVALSRVAARELAPRIRVNTVSPGAVDTPFLRGGFGRAADPQAPLRFDLEAYLRQVPLGRLAGPEDVVGPVMFLLGPGSAYMAGEVLHVSGGAVMA